MGLPAEFNYQGYIRKRIVKQQRLGVLAKPGSGKTRPIIDALVELGAIIPHADDKEKFPLGPILVLCSGPAVAQWSRQIPLWTDDPSIEQHIVHVSGHRDVRMHIWQDVAIREGGICIINASVFRRDIPWIMQIPWAAVVADEYHKYMLRRKSQTFKLFRTLVRHVPIVIPATGSSLRKNPSSMWTLFHIMDPKVFRGYWKFVYTWCIVDDFGFGQQIQGPKNVSQFKELVDRYHAFVPAEVVAEQVPDGRRQPLYVKMTAEQDKIYTDLSVTMIAELKDDIIVAANPLVKMLRLRQLLCCPKILDESLGMGAGFEAIIDRMDDDPHIAIFVPFRPAVEHVYKALVDLGYKDTQWLKGGIPPEEQSERIAICKDKRSPLVCTIAFAESWDLETCCSSFFLGYDFVLDVNQQAEGRTQRAISNHEFVTWNYIRYNGTIDEHFLGNISADLRNVDRINARSPEFIQWLRGKN